MLLSSHIYSLSNGSSMENGSQIKREVKEEPKEENAEQKKKDKEKLPRISSRVSLLFVIESIKQSYNLTFFNYFSSESWSVLKLIQMVELQS